MALRHVELRNYRCFTGDSPLIVPMDASVIAFVGPNNSGKTAALKAFYELRPLWQQANPQAFTAVYGRNQGVGTFLDVKDNQREVISHGATGPLSIDWVFAREANEETNENDVSRIRMWIDPQTGSFKARLTLWSGTALSEEPGLSWDETSEVFGMPGLAVPAKARGFAQAARRFGNAKFIPAIRSTTNSSTGMLFGSPQGATLAQEWNKFKTGHDKSGHEKADIVEETLKRLFGFDALQINVNPDDGSFSIKAGRYTYRLDEIGNGFSHLLYFAIDTINRPASMILIDEPETALHPALQRELLSFLSERCGGNLYYATHSVGLARSFADRVLALHRQQGKLTIGPLEALRSYAEWLGELSFSTWHDLGFAGVLLVEGPTEVRALPHLLSQLELGGKLLLQSLGGSDFINSKSAVTLGEYKRLNCPIFVLIDSERDRESQALSDERRAFLDACTSLGYKTHALTRRAFENYLSTDAISRVVRGTSRALYPFEKLVGSAPGWTKSRVPEITYEMKLGDINTTDLGEFLVSIKSTLRA